MCKKTMQLALLCAVGILASVPSKGPNRQRKSAVRPCHHAWTHHRWNRIALVLGLIWASEMDALRRSVTCASAPAKQKIDAQGKVVAPGFIDMLGQSELTILVDPRLPSKIFQGITTEITGEGGSVAPLNDAIVAADRAGYEHLHITPDWRSFRAVFCPASETGDGDQSGQLCRGNVRTQNGPRRRQGRSNADTIGPDEGLVDQAMQDGAVGVSRLRCSTRPPHTQRPRN